LRGAAAPEKAAAKTESKTASSAQLEPLNADYVIQPLDVIRIQIYQEPDLGRELKVSQDGTVLMPFIGTVEVKNKTVRQAQELIRTLYDADYLVNPQVNITVLEYSQRRVEIFGSVGNPGIIVFPKEEGLTLTAAISLAGSFTRLANKKGITIRRTLPDGKIETIGPINGDELTKGDAANTYPLQPGDVITVPERVL
jgi:polysaccharide export outer membrane protein